MTMLINYESREFDEPGTFLDCTVVEFMDHQASNREALVTNLPETGILYHKEVFPEEIVIVGHIPVKCVHWIITGENWDQLDNVKAIKRIKTEPPRPIEKQPTKPRYL